MRADQIRTCRNPPCWHNKYIYNFVIFRVVVFSSRPLSIPPKLCKHCERWLKDAHQRRLYQYKSQIKVEMLCRGEPHISYSADSLLHKYRFYIFRFFSFSPPTAYEFSMRALRRILRETRCVQIAFAIKKKEKSFWEELHCRVGSHTKSETERAENRARNWHRFGKKKTSSSKKYSQSKRPLDKSKLAGSVTRIIKDFAHFRMLPCLIEMLTSKSPCKENPLMEIPLMCKWRCYTQYDSVDHRQKPHVSSASP